MHMVNREAERSCEEETLANIGCHPAAYARSLLDVLERKHQLHVAPALPGVRPVEITAKRMERIMRLGQGSHRRRPWSVAVLLLIGSTIALPGAAWVVGQETKSASDETSASDSATRKDRQPKRTVNDFLSQARPAPLAKGGSSKAAREVVEEFSVEKYPVVDLIPKVCEELRIERPEAERVLAVPLPMFSRAMSDQTTVHGLSTEFVIDGHGPCKLGGNEPLAKVVGDHLYVFGDAKLKDAMKQSLELIREYGLHQLTIAVRIVTVPVEMMESMDIEWTIVSPESRSDDKVAPSYDGSLSPTLVGILDGEHAAEFVESIQNHSKANVLLAPRITLFNA
jgi:hypothetical protein